MGAAGDRDLHCVTGLLAEREVTMWSRPEPLELTCPKCSADLAVALADEGAEPIRCPQCGFRLDLDGDLLASGFQELWPDEVEARAR